MMRDILQFNLLSGNGNFEKSKKVERSQGLPDFTIGYVNQSLIGFQNFKW
jgi:hypothetical protein